MESGFPGWDGLVWQQLSNHSFFHLFVRSFVCLVLEWLVRIIAYHSQWWEKANNIFIYRLGMKRLTKEEQKTGRWSCELVNRMLEWLMVRLKGYVRIFKFVELTNKAEQSHSNGLMLSSGVIILYLSFYLYHFYFNFT